MNVVQNRIALSNAIVAMAMKASDEDAVGFVVASSGPGSGNGTAASASALLLDLGFDCVDGNAPELPGRASVLLTMFCEEPLCESIVDCVNTLRFSPAGTVIGIAAHEVPLRTVVAAIRDADMAFGRRTLVEACTR